jgi:hypothetical protein
MRRLALLFALSTGAIWAQANWPYLFDDGNYYCAPSSCENDISLAPNTSGQVGIVANAYCYSGMNPHVEDAVLALNCSVPVFLVAIVSYGPVSYIDDYSQLVTADGLVASATAYAEIGMLIYPYWQATKNSDCFDDAEVEHIQGGIPC